MRNGRAAQKLRNSRNNIHKRNKTHRRPTVTDGKTFPQDSSQGVKYEVYKECNFSNSCDTVLVS